MVGTRANPAIDPEEREEELRVVELGDDDPLDVLHHVLQVVFGFGPGSPVRLAIDEAGVESMADLLTLDNEEISCLKYPSSGVTGEEADIYLKALHVSKLKKISPFHTELCRRHGTISFLDAQWIHTSNTGWE